MDALSRILEAIRLRSSVLSIAELDPPFGVRTRGVRDGAVFHAVVRGRALLRVGSGSAGTEHALEDGDVAVLAAGQPHELLDRSDTPSRPIETLPKLEGAVPIVTQRRGDGAEASTRIVCGVFRLDHAASALPEVEGHLPGARTKLRNSLLSLLPELLLHQRSEADPKASEWMRATVAMLDRELASTAEGGGAIAGRLCDVLFVQLLRSTKVQHRGFLAALADPNIGRALALIHEDPRTRWDAGVLAERVGMSRSRFFARFSELVGEPPATYLSRWRMSVVADELRRSDASVARLAEGAGYDSEDAFARVFKRHFGVTPAAFRRQARVEPS